MSDPQLWVGVGLLLLGAIFAGLRWLVFFRMRLLLKHLPPVEADIVWARWRYRKSFTEIGTKMGKTRQYVNYRYSRGMERLDYLRKHKT